MADIYHPNIKGLCQEIAGMREKHPAALCCGRRRSRRRAVAAGAENHRGLDRRIPVRCRICRRARGAPVARRRAGRPEGPRVRSFARSRRCNPADPPQLFTLSEARKTWIRQAVSGIDALRGDQRADVGRAAETVGSPNILAGHVRPAAEREAVLSGIPSIDIMESCAEHPVPDDIGAWMSCSPISSSAAPAPAVTAARSRSADGAWYRRAGVRCASRSRALR